MDLADVNFTAAKQTFASITSGVMAMSRIPAPEFGVESLFYSLVDQFGADYWVYYSPLSNNFFLNKDATLTSLWINNGKALQKAKYSRSYASFIADPLHHNWGKLTRLELGYEVIVGNPDPGEKLGNVTFSDCADGSFYLLVRLVDAYGKEIVDLRIEMGGTENVKTGCAQAATYLSNSNLIDNEDYRASGGMTIKQSQEKYKDLYLRSISVVVEGGQTESANHRVKLYSARVGNIKLAELPWVRQVPDTLAQAGSAHAALH
jgi:hypothetical protein